MRGHEARVLALGLAAFIVMCVVATPPKFWTQMILVLALLVCGVLFLVGYAIDFVIMRAIGIAIAGVCGIAAAEVVRLGLRVVGIVSLVATLITIGVAFSRLPVVNALALETIPTEYLGIAGGCRLAERVIATFGAIYVKSLLVVSFGSLAIGAASD